MTLCFDDAYNDGEYEEYTLQKLVISYSDGSTYVVVGTDMINYMSAVYDSENNGIIHITFNRLVDVETISNVSVEVVHSSSHGTTEVSYSVS